MYWKNAFITTQNVWINVFKMNKNKWQYGSTQKVWIVVII